MTELCINTRDILVPETISLGEIYPAEGGPKTVAIKCIRKITKEEYLKFVQEKGLLSYVRRGIDSPELNFYLVEILD